jgi:LDH2 family malate/lactate/ureidoglycolate dehydrogenase
MKCSQFKLEAWCAKVMEAAGVNDGDARLIAGVLVNADMRGVFSHGCRRLEGYVDCIKTGGIKPNAVPFLEVEGDSYALVNAGQGLGIPVSVYAMNLAKKKAKKAGITIINVKNSHHHGACGYYSLMCADDGMIGLAMSTGDVIMAAYGGSSPVIGNNPFSYALPAGKYRAVCYDIAMSVVAAGKVSIAADMGKKIPEGWILSPDGGPTTDPEDYARGGALLPFGGYKGYGLSVMVESLGGILSGAALLKDIHAWNHNPEIGGGVGHCFIAIEPKLLNPELDLPAQTEKMIEELTGAAKAPGADRIYFPGQIENEKEEGAKKNGIELPEASENALKRASQGVNLPFLEP